MTTLLNEMRIVLKLVNLRLKSDGSDELMSDLVANSIVAAVDTCATDLLTLSFDESLHKSMDDSNESQIVNFSLTILERFLINSDPISKVKIAIATPASLNKHVQHIN